MNAAMHGDIRDLLELVRKGYQAMKVSKKKTSGKIPRVPRDFYCLNLPGPFLPKVYAFGATGGSLGFCVP